MTPGQELKKARNAAGLTLDQLAYAVGVTQSAVTQWEAGRTIPRLGKAIALDDALHADGAILAAFGYARPSSQADELAALGRRMDELSEKVDRLLARLEEPATPPVRHLRAASSQDGSVPPRASGKGQNRPSPPADDGDHLED